jgi:hypothetical protein
MYVRVIASKTRSRASLVNAVDTTPLPACLTTRRWSHVQACLLCIAVQCSVVSAAVCTSCTTHLQAYLYIFILSMQPVSRQLLTLSLHNGYAQALSMCSKSNTTTLVVRRYSLYMAMMRYCSAVQYT